MSKLHIALGVYVLLAVAAWFTLPDQRFRYITIAFLAFFAIRTWTTSMRSKLADHEKKDEPEGARAGN